MRASTVLSVALCVTGCGRLGFEPGAGADPDAAVVDARVLDATPPDAAVPGATPLPGLEVPDLLAHYLVDVDAPGHDASGNQLHGTCGARGQCPALAATPESEFWPAYTFELDPGGPVAYIEIAADVADAMRTGFSITVWAKAYSYSDYMTVYAKPYGTGSLNSWKLGNAADGLFFESSDGSGIQYTPTAEALPLQTWAHVAVTWDAQSVKRLYLDGKLLVEETNEIVFDNNDMLIGVDIDDPSLRYPFDGQLHDLRIYKRALSADEIMLIRGH
ncbi:LamG domain-containing protein [Haliangium ochraceum]|uniref:LamG domain protein jellyroll fold domain protein n=1 Tax=Haliangium ochraceum (strain DSM 14365 / JCM 11303 / SMP-2) TaxID=502025 RepID=D0LHU3_HALO1|nr:LamG domain-containing protein [Haliangium ochraceum]ACY14772.1 LamG domain protein jellyroll fold domain protein [Haliangium ochraceum DSM 14365]